MTLPSDPSAVIHADRAGAPMSEGEARLGDLTNLEPDTWPEVLREQTALAGAVDCSLRAARDLRERLAHVLRPSEPSAMPPAPPPYETTSALGARQRAAYFEAVETEHVLRDIERRLAV